MLSSSHDRWFLDRVTSRTLSFEPATQGSKVVEYRGGYSHYARQRADRDASVLKVASRQQEEIARTEEYIDKFRAGQRSKQSRGRAKQLARLERIDAPLQTARHGWTLDAAHLAGATVLETTPLAVGHGERVVVRTPPLRVERGARIAVVGANGAGKTTLVRTLVGQLPAIDGYVSSAPTARVAFLAQAQAELTGDETVIDALRDETGLGDQEARDLLARFLFRGDDVFRSVGVLSGGERSRLALAQLSARQANLLVLDEPTNHLDLAAREQLESVLSEYEGTIVAVSHDRYFIDRLASEIWDVRDATLKRYEGGWNSFEKARDDGRALPDPETRAVPSPAPPRGAAGLRPTGRDATRRKGRGDPRAREAAPGAPAKPGPATRRTASRVRKVEGVRALEARIAAMELQLTQLSKKLEQVAQGGNFMETRQLGTEHAELERSLKGLYEEWSANAEPGEESS